MALSFRWKCWPPRLHFRNRIPVKMPKPNFKPFHISWPPLQHQFNSILKDFSETSKCINALLTKVNIFTDISKELAKLEKIMEVLGVAHVATKQASEQFPSSIEEVIESWSGRGAEREGELGEDGSERPFRGDTEESYLIMGPFHFMDCPFFHVVFFCFIGLVPIYKVSCSLKQSF